MNADLVKKIEGTSLLISTNGGIHFDRVMELKQFCQTLLYMNDWSPCAEEEIGYTHNMNRLIEAGMTIFRVDKPRSEGLIRNKMEEDEVSVKYQDITYRTTWRNRDGYSSKLNEMSRHCLHCGSSLHCTFEHEPSYLQGDVPNDHLFQGPGEDE